MRQFAINLLCVGVSSLLTITAAADPALDEAIDAYDAYRLWASPFAEADANDTLPDHWPDISPAATEAAVEKLEAIDARLDAIEEDGLTEDERLNLEILSTIVDGDLALMAFDEERLPFTGDWGFHASVTFQLSRTRITDAADAEATLKLLAGVPAFLDANIENMERGLETGFVSYKDPLETVIVQIDEIIETPITETGFYQPFRSLPDHMSDEEKAEYQAQARTLIAGVIKKLKAVNYFFKNTYAPQTRETAGVVSFPEAKAYYQAVLSHHTTRPDLTPEDVHEIGKSEVARIRAEMDAIIEEVGFEGSFAEFLDFLRTDPQFYAQTPEELMATAARIAKDIDYQMPKFFYTLPRLSYGVEPVPAAIAPGYTTGRYVGGSLKEGKAGAYWVNTYALDQRALYELPSLTAHEAVPGHHHQIALAQELEDVPEFRRDYYATAFGEGWGLYSESLATEMGIYDTPYKRFGKLSYEMWRACRLVADTGLHWYGWTREEAEKCFIENSALSPLNIKTEVTRYIGWPGQATAYKIGELTIKALREEAETALGADFDIREFHDVVLEKGSMPLAVLEERVRTWIASKDVE